MLSLSQCCHGLVFDETELYLYVCIMAGPCTFFFRASDRFAHACKISEINFCVFIVIKVLMATMSN